MKFCFIRTRSLLGYLVAAGWVFLLLFSIALWIMSYFSPLTMYAQSRDVSVPSTNRNEGFGFSAWIGEANGGRLLIFYTRVHDPVTLEHNELDFERDHLASQVFFDWRPADATDEDYGRRSVMQVPLLGRSRPYPPFYEPYVVQGPHLVLPFKVGLLKFAHGKSRINPASHHMNLMTYLQVIVPFWLLAVILAIPGVFFIQPAARLLRRWQAACRLGCCPACGYDLRATPDRCPECGLEVPDRGEESADRA